MQELLLIDNAIQSPLNLTSTTLTRLDLDTEAAIVCALSQGCKGCTRCASTNQIGEMNSLLPRMQRVSSKPP
jgi:hypothetical protein